MPEVPGRTHAAVLAGHGGPERCETRGAWPSPRPGT